MSRSLPGSVPGSLAIRRRQVLFACVGGSCFVVQFCLLTALVNAGVQHALANAIGFAISAQLNFALSSRLTWADRRAPERGTPLHRWASYNATAVISLMVNVAVFQLVYQRIGNLAAAAAGVLVGLAVTYLVCDHVIFRKASSARHRAVRGSRQGSRWPHQYTATHRMPHQMPLRMPLRMPHRLAPVHNPGGRP